jgi:hypothetical protein
MLWLPQLKRQQERPPAPVEGATPSDGSLLDNAEKGTDWIAARHQLPPKWVDVVNKVCITGQAFTIAGVLMRHSAHDAIF